MALPSNQQINVRVKVTMSGSKSKSNSMLSYVTHIYIYIYIYICVCTTLYVHVFFLCCKTLILAALWPWSALTSRATGKVLVTHQQLAPSTLAMHGSVDVFAVGCPS